MRTQQGAPLCCLDPIMDAENARVLCGMLCTEMSLKAPTNTTETDH
jgi:hypothetical protein